MRPKVWILGIFFGIVLSVLAHSGHANLPDTFGGWQTRSFQPIPASLIDRFAGNDGLVLHEYGFVSGQRREYARDDANLTVTLWQMRDATGSYGLLTFLQQQGMEELGQGGRILRGRDRLLARQGVYVLDARGDSVGLLTDEEAESLMHQIPVPRRGEDILPPLPEYLPEENLQDSSTRFLMGPVAFERSGVKLPPSLLGFDLGAEAALAQYRLGRDDLQLLLVSYATPQLAAKQLRSFEEAAAASGSQGSNVRMRRIGSLLAFVFDAPSDAQADNLFSGIRYESFVTWNEYVPGPRDNVGALLIGAFVLAGFVLLVTLVAGISFGGVRYLAKRFLPWDVFDRPSQMEIIKLNLSDK
jgi:hypothetical protein